MKVLRQTLYKIVFALVALLMMIFLVITLIWRAFYAEKKQHVLVVDEVKVKPNEFQKELDEWKRREKEEQKAQIDMLKEEIQWEEEDEDYQKKQEFREAKRQREIDDHQKRQREIDDHQKKLQRKTEDDDDDDDDWRAKLEAKKKANDEKYKREQEAIREELRLKQETYRLERERRIQEMQQHQDDIATREAEKEHADALAQKIRDEDEQLRLELEAREKELAARALKRKKEHEEWKKTHEKQKREREEQEKREEEERRERERQRKIEEEKQEQIRIEEEKKKKEQKIRERQERERQRKIREQEEQERQRQIEEREAARKKRDQKALQEDYDKYDSKYSYKLDIKYVNSFYNNNLDFFDLDKIVKTQPKLELDKARMNNWIKKVSKQWDKLSSKQKQEKLEESRKKYGFAKKTNLLDQALTKLSIKTQEEEKPDPAEIYYTEKAPKNLYKWFATNYVNELSKNFITWEQFREQIRIVAEDVKNLFKQKKWSIICFLVSGSAQRANSWMFFVFWKYLKDHIPSDTECKFVSINTQPVYQETIRISNYFASKSWRGPSIVDLDYTRNDVLILNFCNVSYHGNYIYDEQIFFRDWGKGYPPNYYVVLPYISHRAKRTITEMDNEKNMNKKFLYTQFYVDGNKGNYKLRETEEKNHFEESRVKFLPNTKVLVEIPSDHELIPLGTERWTVVAAMMPYEMTHNEFILHTQIAHSFGVIPDENIAEPKFVKDFKPISFIKGHKYKKKDIERIKQTLFRPGDQTYWKKKYSGKYQVTYKKIIDDELLPIRTFYDNKYNVKKGDTDENITIEFDHPDNRYRGIFALLEDASKR